MILHSNSDVRYRDEHPNSDVRYRDEISEPAPKLATTNSPENQDWENSEKAPLISQMRSPDKIKSKLTGIFLGGRVLFAVVTLEDGVGAPDVAFTGVACTLKFCRDSFSNCTRQNFLKFCQLVRNGESGRFTLMTRND